MSLDKTTPFEVPPVRQRMLRYTIASVNAVLLLGSILLVTWILGKMIGALHALVFSLAFATTPDHTSPEFPLLEDTNTRVEVHSMLDKQPQKPVETDTLYSL